MPIQKAWPFHDGAYYLGAIADEFDAQLELNEMNNPFAGRRIGIGHRSDMVVTAISAPPSVLRGATFFLEVEVCNQGTVSTGYSEVALYLSSNNHLEEGEDIYLGLVSTPPIDADSCVAGGGTFTPNPSGADGTYYLGAVADAWNLQTELLEDNNRYIGAQIGVGNGPDLVISSVDGEDFALPSGDLGVNSIVCNQGTAASVATQISYYLSTDTVVGAGDVMIASGSIPGLVAGACHSGQAVGWLPGVALGAYFIGAVVDASSSVFELNESNNARTGDGMEVALVFCGNGTVDQPGEQCDDNNNYDGDGCTFACVEEFCGDGVINNGGIEECDDANATAWDGCSASCELENPRFGEVGTLSQSQPNRATWHTVNLQRTYRNPVVLMAAASRNDVAPAHLRVRNVTATSFQWQIEEWAYLDGAHGAETVNYLVLESGRRTLEDGTILEAGRTTASNIFRIVNFTTPFAVAPVVLTAVNSFVDSVPVITRTRNTIASRFEVRVQEEEAQPVAHGTETISWLAILSGNGVNNGQQFVAGTTPDAVTDAFYTINFPPIFGPALPVFIGHADRFDGTEPAVLRWRNLTASSVQVSIEEDDSLDPEHVHTTEAVTYLAWAAPGFVTFQPSATENPSCDDLLDNDGDLLVDCADPQCLHVAPCP